MKYDPIPGESQSSPPEQISRPEEDDEEFGLSLADWQPSER